MKAFNKTKMEALLSVGGEIRGDAMNILDKNSSDTATLSRSIKVEKTNKNKVSVSTNSGYGLYVEFGRPSGNTPPVSELIPWVRRKLGIRNHKKAKRVAYAIAKGIGKRGTKAQPFLRPAFERGIKRMKTQLRQEIAKMKDIK